MKVTIITIIILICVFSLILSIACCKAASFADEQEERMMKEYREQSAVKNNTGTY